MCEATLFWSIDYCSQIYPRKKCLSWMSQRRHYWNAKKSLLIANDLNNTCDGDCECNGGYDDDDHSKENYHFANCFLPLRFLSFFLSFFLSYVLKACAKQLLNRDLISQRWLMLLQSKMCEKTDWELWLSIAKIKTRFLKTRPLFVYFRSFHKNISMKSSLAAVKGKRFHECAVYLFLV